MRYCSNCGKELPDEAVFCSNCGTPVEKDDLEATGLLDENNYGENERAFSDDELEETGLLDDPYAPYTAYQTNPAVNSSVKNEVKQPSVNEVPQAYVNPNYQAAQNPQQVSPTVHNSYYNAQQQSNAQPLQNQYSSQQYKYAQMPFAKRNNIFKSYALFWKNYINFSGRTRRSDYWQFVLVNFIIAMLLGVLSFILYTAANLSPYLINRLVIGAYALATLIPNLAIQIRRLHDIGKDWYYIFFILIPIAGPIILLVWYCQDSQFGANKYGDNPKGINSL